jgi:hypothetical protein
VSSNRMFTGYLIGCGMIMIVFLVSMLIEPFWVALLINGLLGGIVGFMIAEYGNA